MVVVICTNMSKNSTINASVESKKRLLRDLKEIHEHPLENVTAAPVADSNMFIWHANCMYYYHIQYFLLIHFFLFLFFLLM